MRLAQKRLRNTATCFGVSEASLPAIRHQSPRLVRVPSTCLHPGKLSLYLSRVGLSFATVAVVRQAPSTSVLATVEADEVYLKTERFLFGEVPEENLDDWANTF